MLGSNKEEIKKKDKDDSENSLDFNDKEKHFKHNGSLSEEKFSKGDSGSGHSSYDGKKVYKESSALRISIVNEILEPSYYQDVKEYVEERKSWRHIGSYFGTISKILVGLSGVSSFASGTYKDENFSFIAGCISVISLVCLQFSSYALKESKQKTIELNKILSKLNISNVPDTSYNSIDDKDKNEKSV